ncbi:hypothetical protein KP509_09G012300 [Ceratopteris richardii]|uniref:2-dehydro-3-deoxyphosphogluconate aldolase n=1 Tax=Ceratopteris richardii TaxID=49495 RepID=A0A8T2U4M4_CERRI|nr:hypothetical protein KP509_09G012300 [Ceratopteris richardii]
MLSPAFPLRTVSHTTSCIGRLSMSCVTLHSRLAAIQQSGVIACVRAQKAEIALDMARAALDGGLDVLEITMTTPSAPKAIMKLVEEYPSALIGAGTILSMNDADLAKAAGAQFLMSPVTMQDLIVSHHDGPMVIIPGAITPTEIFNAYNKGARLIKLYPVSLMGGVKFVEALKKSMPHIQLVASQGITFETFDQYLTMGAAAVVLSDAIFNKTFVDSRDYRKIQQQATAVARKAASTRHSLQL